MGTNYRANFGVGIEIKSPPIEDSLDEFYEVHEHLEDITENSPYEFKEYGDGGYTGDSNTFIIYIKDPFKDGYDITNKVNEFKQWLLKEEIFENEEDMLIDLVGGLNVC